jgi:hypothetical protein
VPIVRFRPTADQVEEQTLATLHGYWERLMEEARLGGADLPGVQLFDPLEISRTLTYVMMIDVLEEGLDFQYRVYGREIAERFGRDLTGMKVSEVPIEPRITAFFQAVYRASIARREAVFTEHAPPPSVSVTKWRRLILPFTDAHGMVVRFVVGNIPGTWRRPDQGGA